MFDAFLQKETLYTFPFVFLAQLYQKEAIRRVFEHQINSLITLFSLKGAILGCK